MLVIGGVIYVGRKAWDKEPSQVAERVFSGPAIPTPLSEKTNPPNEAGGGKEPGRETAKETTVAKADKPAEKAQKAETAEALAAKAEPEKGDGAKSEVAKAEPSKPESAKEGSPKTESAKTDEVAKGETEKAEPKKAEVEKEEIAKTEQPEKASDATAESEGTLAEGSLASSLTGGPTEENAHDLVIEAKEKTWLKVVIDDKPPVQLILPAGEKKTYGAKEKIKLVLGNSTGSVVTHNGEISDGSKIDGTIRSYTFPPAARFPQDVPKRSTAGKKEPKEPKESKEPKEPKESKAEEETYVEE